MSLERNIRVLFQGSEAHALDEEGRGLSLLAEGYELLLQGRAKQRDLLGSGAELGEADLLVLAAEAAVKNEDFATAADAAHRFFLQGCARNQFYCRALFAQAVVESQRAGPLRGAAAVLQQQKAVALIMEALDIATAEANRGNYDFLVYNASVCYWAVARELFRPGSRQYVLGGVRRIVDALEATDDADKEWRAKMILILVECMDEAGEVEAATPYVELLIQHAAVSGNPGLMEEARRIQVHLARHGHGDAAKLMSSAREEAAAANNVNVSFMVELQSFRSKRAAAEGQAGPGQPGPGYTPAEAGDAERDISELLDRFYPAVLTPAAAKVGEGEHKGKEGEGGEGGGGEDGASKEEEKTVDAELVVMAGRLAFSYGLDDLASKCLDASEAAKGMTARGVILGDYLRSELLSTGAISADRGKGGGGKGGRGGAGGGKKRPKDDKMTLRELEAQGVARRVEAMKLIERTLVACKRLAEPELIQEGTE
jgi:hypothetical protein